MGVDVTHIIRNDYQEYFKKETRKSYAEQTLKTLKERLGTGVDSSVFVDEDFEFETTFQIYDLEFTLRNGFWQIESYYHYVQLLFCVDDNFFLRSMIFDVARVLGQTEAWHAKEHYTWNGGLDEMESCSLEEWLEYAAQTDCGISEFDPKQWRCTKSIENYGGIYHDSFEDYKTRFTQVQRQIMGYELLGTRIIGKHFYRTRKNGGIYLIDSRTFSPVNTEPYDDIIQDFSGLEFVIRKGNLSALFDGDGNPLSEFMEGSFSWSWYGTHFHKRKIYNETTGFSIVRD